MLKTNPANINLKSLCAFLFLCSVRSATAAAPSYPSQLTSTRRVFDPDDVPHESVESCSQWLVAEVCRAASLPSLGRERVIEQRPRSVIWKPPVPGKCSALEAEFWAVFEGLQCAWQLGCRRILVESDNTDVVRALQAKVTNTVYSSLLGHIRTLLRYNWEVKFCHVFREGNRVVDSMTKVFSLDSFNRRIFLVPHDEVLPVLQQDQERLICGH
ncbi:hypothetical protein V6N11_048833 [Hibiscus sabdariffa]|uniref:RNase H type-1 domain-containing protein n=1 Tax=Hibiscus sabdariffa TaxID=183260 RepID=A0ABR2PWL7_9ROSI